MVIMLIMTHIDRLLTELYSDEYRGL